MKRRQLASRLPERLLRFLHRHWKVAFDPADGWTLWMDASYAKWVRRDMRRDRYA